LKCPQAERENLNNLTSVNRFRIDSTPVTGRQLGFAVLAFGWPFQIPLHSKLTEWIEPGTHSGLYSDSIRLQFERCELQKAPRSDINFPQRQIR